MVRSALVLLILFFMVPRAPGQDLQPGTHELGVWAAFSPASPTLIGTATERQLALLGLRYGFFFARSWPVTFEYTADFVPVAVVLQPWFGREFVERPPLTPAGSGRTPVYGFGFAPIGFKFHFGARKVSPFLALSAGMIYTTEPVPITRADTTELNFMFDFGGGLQLVLPRRRTVMFGYKFHHISNANRTDVNPGLDSNALYVGYSFLR